MSTIECQVRDVLPMLRLSVVAESDVALRRGLCQVRLFPDGLAVATDGFILSQARHPIPGADFGIENGPALTAAYKELTKLSRKGSERPISVTLTETHIILAFDLCSHPQGLFLPLVRGEYARVESFISGMDRVGQASNRIMVDFDRLRQAVDGLMPGPNRTNQVILEYRDAGAPLLIYRDPQALRADAILMPLRMPDRVPPVITEVSNDQG